jgi:hypothetical protein
MASGMMSEEDLFLIKKRAVRSDDKILLATLRVFKSNVEAEACNKNILNSVPGEVCTIKAIDIWHLQATIYPQFENRSSVHDES